MAKRAVRYGEHPSQFVEVWPPEARPHLGAVVLVHGGWWRARHDLHLMDELAADLANRGHLVWNVEYRRIEGDGGGWPGTFDDVLAAVDLLCAEREGGVGRSSIVALGHSAGGQLALLSARERGLGGVVALAPITDLDRCAAADLGEGATQVFIGGAPAAQREHYRKASPVEQVPIGCPQLVVHGTDDDRVPVSHSRAYAKRAAAVGDKIKLRVVTGGDHMFVLDPRHRYWPNTVDWIGDATR
ncbi:MAG: alpha/beta hydrolase family protein [Dehalococcoidia bacterium]